jgi:hypothetical protein
MRDSSYFQAGLRDFTFFLAGLREMMIWQDAICRVNFKHLDGLDLKIFFNHGEEIICTHLESI